MGDGSKKYSGQTIRMPIKLSHHLMRKIDSLVEQGYFSNRSEFLRVALFLFIYEHFRKKEKQVVTP